MTLIMDLFIYHMCIELSMLCLTCHVFGPNYVMVNLSYMYRSKYVVLNLSFLF
jgi:hypothetical protein